jgi:hypothetical protein
MTCHDRFNALTRRAIEIGQEMNRTKLDTDRERCLSLLRERREVRSEMEVLHSRLAADFVVR